MFLRNWPFREPQIYVRTSHTRIDRFRFDDTRHCRRRGVRIAGCPGFTDKFYGATGESRTVIGNGRDGILATTIATSYKEMARGLSFDQITDWWESYRISNPS